MNRYRFFAIITFLNCLALSFFVSRLPNSVPIHINMYNKVDSMGSPWSLVLFSAIPFFVFLILSFFKAKDSSSVVRKGKHSESLIWGAVLVLLLSLSWIIFYGVAASGAQLGDTIKFSMELTIGIPLSFFFIVLGNFLGVIKQNFYLGIRTPWTLKSPLVWAKTHRLGAFTTTLGGVVMLCGCILGYFLKNSLFSFWGILGGAVGLALIPCVYSYILYKKIEKA